MQIYQSLAGYRNNGQMYAVAAQKGNRLHIFEIPSGKLVLLRKFGPWSNWAYFGVAVSEKYMIGITAIGGSTSFGRRLRYKIREDLMICNTGTMLAFDLHTGNILWQIVNPYGHYNDSYCWNDTLWT